jgi:hypothetical protein
MALRYRTADTSNERSNAALVLMVRVRTILGVDGDTVVSVAGHHCGDPVCGEPATTILLMRPGRPTNAVRIAKPVETVTEADLQAALQPIACQEAQQE